MAVEGSILNKGHVFQNSLTLANTNILLGVHSICASSILVQCCEYQHVYWSLFCSGCSMMFYVLTGLHGAHVAFGVSILCIYCSITTFYWVGSVSDNGLMSGCLGILAYWHFVDTVWVLVVTVVYSAVIWLG